jgi:hypothetical protein
VSKIDPAELVDAPQSWWWIPGDEANSLPGRLVVPAGQAGELYLEGSYPSHAEERGTHDVLWGFLTSTSSCEQVTCVTTRFLQETGVTHNDVGHTGTRSMVKWVFLGAHVAPEDLRIVAFELHWESIDEWFGKRLTLKGNWFKGEPIQAAASELVQESCDVPSIDGKLELAWAGSTSYGVASATLSRALLWKVTFSQSKEIGDAHDVMRVLRDFVWLAVGGQVGARSVRMKMANGCWVTLLGSQLYSKPRAPWTQSGTFMSLPYRYALEGRFCQVINAWLQLRTGKLEDAFSAWPLVIEGAVGPVEPALGAVMQFLDAILPKKGLYMDKEQYDAVANEIIGALPKDLSDELLGSLRGAIRGANNQGLGSRLQAAMDALPPALSKAYGLDEGLRKKARDARNALAHSGGRRGITVSEAAMVHGRMRLVALVHTLQRVGIPDDLIVKRVENCFSWQPPISVETL